ncbi:MAG: hypothetical protein J5855_08985 [Mailhella sp.]|nr:hypothetical protein [Mailhella sp.]
MADKQTSGSDARKSPGRFTHGAALALMAFSMTLICGMFVMNRIKGDGPAIKDPPAASAPAGMTDGAASAGLNMDQIPQAMRNALAAKDGKTMPPVSEDAMKGMMGTAQMPSEIPQAMYDAMKRRGMTIPDTVTVVPDAPADTPAASADPAGAPAQAPAARSEADPATAAILEMVQAAPHDADILLKAAAMLAKNGRADLAQEQLNHAMVAAPGDARPSRELGRMLAEAGRYEEAAERLAYSVERTPDPEALLLLVHVYRHHLGKPDLARAYALTLKSLPVEDAQLKQRIDDELAALQN